MMVIMATECPSKKGRMEGGIGGREGGRKEGHFCTYLSPI